MDRSGAVAELRAAVACFVRDHAAEQDRWCVALSGGPDSLALAAVAAKMLPTTALIVDHRLQSGFGGDRLDCARDRRWNWDALVHKCFALTSAPREGPEAAARTARYRALDEARAGMPVLLAHTLDDQAETVLLGLGRGSGARSIAGMRPHDPPWCRPLLGVRRAVDPCWRAPNWASHRGRTRTTPTPASPGCGCAPRCCRCSKTSSAAASPRRWPAPRPRCARTPTCSTAWLPTSCAGLSAGGDAGGLPVAVLGPLPERGPAQGDQGLAACRWGGAA